MGKIYFSKFTKNYKFGICIEKFNSCCKNLKLKNKPYKTGIRTWTDSINRAIAFVYKTKRIIFYFPLKHKISDK